MNPLSFAQISTAVRAKDIRASDPSIKIDTICTDTRKLRPGCLFIALKGDTHDGHSHLMQAASGGAIAAIVEVTPKIAPAGLTLIKVPDSRKAMGRLANFVRSQLTSTVIAVAGSNGKPAPSI